MPLGVRVFDAAELGMDDDTYWKLENQFDNSSIAFTVEILPTLWSLLENVNGEISLLDVGARTGAGTHLIAYLHQTLSTSRFKIKTTAVDLDSQYYLYSKKNYPFANLVIGDAGTLFKGRQFDIVLCSHTIEHVPEPELFLDQLRSLAKGHVIIACPFEEVNLIPGHVNRLDKDFFKRTGATELKVYRSLGWHQSMACIAVYEGSASYDTSL